MAWFEKRKDPLLERESRLKAQLAEVESQIAELDAAMQQTAPEPKWRSTARPRAAAAASQEADNRATLEDLRQPRPGREARKPVSPARLNSQGVAKFDLAGMIRRWKQRFRRQSPRQPQLVTYLAAGSIQGLPALRHEKRVARNRFLLLCAAFLVVSAGIWYWWRGLR
ncbi:MAG: hypothetical protein KDM81_09900 [Verrucomicrobiae bacterium]|nr:hypothetical protein [Verrucomicrobiae bacterium]MCP5522930.1 hypothetical protein [Verrucomicrobiales bacterium]